MNRLETLQNRRLIGVSAALWLLTAVNASAQLSMPPTGASTPPTTKALPKAVATPKQKALQLIAVGRAALDRGDVTTAVRMARQAHALNVPEKAFAAGEPRVWDLLLDSDAAARRAGIDPNKIDPVQATANPVQQAGGISNGQDAGDVAQMLFNQDAVGGGSPAQSIQQVQGYADPGKSFGAALYREGMEALTAGDNETARRKFADAWKYESELDLNTRRQLKEKLTLLQPNRLPPAGKTGQLSAIDQTQLDAQRKAQRLYREVTAELSKASDQAKEKPLASLDDLEKLKRRIDQSDAEESVKRTLNAMVNRDLSKQKLYVEQNKAQIDLDIRNEAIRTEMATDNARERAIDEEISRQVGEFNQLMEQRRFAEAEIIAKQVQELKPGSTIAQSMFHSSRTQTRLLLNQEIRNELEDGFVRNMLDVDRTAIPTNPDREIEFPRTWDQISERRLADTGQGSRLSAREQEIEKRLQTPVNVKYRDRPLGEVLSDLSAMTGVPIVLDRTAASVAGVNESTPINFEISTEISLRSVLNLMLRDLEMTHYIDDEVLNITSEDAKRSRVFPVTYRVTDLVTPIPNFSTSYEDGLAGALRAAYEMSNPTANVQVMPVSMDTMGGFANNRSRANTQLPPNMLGQYAPMGSSGGFGPSNPPIGGRGGGAFADFDSLMQLIQTTIVPDTWELLGGPSTMQPYQQNLSLVISTTSDVHDQIVELLESLRRLQNLQITIEVRFITLADSFFEQIGIDFDVQFDDNVTEIPEEDRGPSVTIGIGQDNLATPDLDITFDNNSFGVTPTFGGFDAGAASTLGFAILSDIEAFFFLQAAQGDNRTNVMQAPKVTLFDGQFASISDVSQRPFVTSITPVVGDFAVAQQPVIVVLNEGTQLNVQGVVSDDKRFVRLTLVPFFSQIGDVDTFTFEGQRTTNTTSRDENGDTNGDGVIDDNDEVDEDTSADFIQGSTVQLPTFAFTQISTTVSVPDGGTILLGGIKRLSEARGERGVPMLSKIPYVSRLFRNTSAGRQSSSLMMMVTPRIIIQEEEEEAQTGFITPR
ncbi:MAG: hypothetical protein AAGA03_12525 [Planctomycetota bacterium]